MSAFFVCIDINDEFCSQTTFSMNKPVLILGGKGIGKAAIEIFKSNKVVVYGVLDDDKTIQGNEISEISVLGTTDDENYLKILGKKCDVFLAYDDTKLKKSLVRFLNEEKQVMPVNAIHGSATIAESAELHHGTLVNAKSVIGAFAKIGNHCVINSGAVIEHEVKLGDFVQIGAGSIINSGAEIGEGAFIGSGVTVVSGIKIGKNARVGAGSVVIENVKDGQTVFGNPAKSV